jgi:hypothetical protein
VALNAPTTLPSSPAPAEDGDPLAPLRSYEATRRAQTDFAHAETSETALGTDPYRILRVDDQRAPVRFVGLLRGRSAIVALDEELRELMRLPAPRSPVSLAASSDGEVFVAGELATSIARYRWARGALRPFGSIELPDVRALRGVAVGPEGVLYVIEEHDGRLVTIVPGADPGSSAPALRRDTPLCHGPAHVMRVGRIVLVDCLLDHAVIGLPVDPRGMPLPDREVRIEHDGPVWGMDALGGLDGPGERDDLLVAVGGVEDHPLDRTQGSFGFVDSFVSLYRLHGDTAAKLAEVNTSELALVTPKALTLRRRAGMLELTVAAYGSPKLALFTWPLSKLTSPPAVVLRDVPPGAAAMARAEDGSLVIADPLIDAWIRVAPDAVDIVHVEDERSRTRGFESRLGEALFFTTLIAPWDKSEGRLSRFTCETCHFEGYVDGRTHHTGRGDIRATTKPLLGLLGNRPYFSRALDPDMTTMVDNEFRVAGAKSGHDPWFSLGAAEIGWLRDLSGSDLPADVAPGLAGRPGGSEAGGPLTPVALRRALMTFFMEFTPRPNPMVLGRARWTDTEGRGAAVFRERCESCHSARLIADDPGSRVPFAQWEQHVMSPEGSIVWASSEYAKTGVMPYVNERGARVVSLRRLFKKYPYFTNGSAKDIRAVLDRIRLGPGGAFAHDGAAPGGVDAAGLAPSEKTELTAFLELL